MLILITYDVNTQSKAGEKRLRKVAKQCVDFGTRVQNSVFECNVNATQFTELKHKLELLIDKELDSLRFYKLGDNYKNKIIHIGAKKTMDVKDPLIV